jgi:hypothetical protein
MNLPWSRRAVFWEFGITFDNATQISCANDEPIKANAVSRGVLAQTSSGRIGARVAVAEDRGEPAGDERGRSRAERNSPPPGPPPYKKSRSTLVVAVVVASSSTQHSPTMSHMSGRRGREARREHGRQVARFLDVVARATRRGSTARTPSRCTTGGSTNCRCLGQRPERVALRPWAGAAGGVGARCWLGTTPMLEASVRAVSGGRTARDDEGGAARERRNARVKLEEHG